MSMRLPMSVMAICLVAGCTSSLPVRIDGPVGATMRIQGRHPESHERLTMPFVARFESGRGYAPYQVLIEIPAEVATEYGGRGEIRLFGELYVWPPTSLVGGGTVTLAEDREKVAALVRGEVAEVWWEVTDPSAQQSLVRIVLRAAPR